MPEQDLSKRIFESVTYSYRTLDVNCAKTTLIALSDIFEQALDEQVLQAATAMNGAGRSRGQCGLMEGALMFFGVFFGAKGASDCDVYNIAKDFVQAFEAEFGSISCYDLRPGGFQKDDPPHACEGLTVKTMEFTCDFLQKRKASRFNLQNL